MDQATHSRDLYQPKPLGMSEEIRADVLVVQKDAEGLLDELIRQDEPVEGVSS